MVGKALWRGLVVVTVVVGCPGEDQPHDDGVDETGSTGAPMGSTSTSATGGVDDTGTGTGDTGDTGEPAAGVPICDEADIDEVEARIDAVLPQLSVSEKVTLLHGAAILTLDGTWVV